MKAALGGVLGFLALAPLMTMAQLRGLGPEFVITRINKNLVPTPQYTLAGTGQQYPVNTRDMWLEVEVEFSAAPPWTDNLTFKYYILFNGKLLTGEVTHTNVAAGRENRSVMYVSPRALARFAGNRSITPGMFQNIAVQIVQQGTVKSELSLQRVPPEWFANIPQITGFLLNKNETPFAPLYWDRYEQIKTAR
jgi:hypothetical protein